MNVAQKLLQEGYNAYLTGFSALDKYFGLHPSGMVSIATEADLVKISTLFEDISYPSIEAADVMIDDPGGSTRYLVRSLEEDRMLHGKLRHTAFWYDFSRKAYQDPCNIYWELRNPGVLDIPSAEEAPKGWEAVSDAAVLVSRYGFSVDTQGIQALRKYALQEIPPMSAVEQQILLKLLLSSSRPDKGLRLLMDCGFVDVHWQILSSMRGVKQNKEFHPEGDVWEHTLETFTYLKDNDISVSLALLLHDVGKAFTGKNGKNSFDQHAQIGAKKAVHFLKSLQFDDSVIKAVSFLIREHMLPSLLKRLPVYRIEKSLDSSYFPQLLEVYRCDVSSTFRGLEDYYQACEMYRKYRRHKKNPYRNSDGSRRIQYG